MIKNKFFLWNIFIFMILLFYTLFELFFILNSQVNPFLGITGNIFYFYMSLVSTLVFLLAIKSGLTHSPKSESFVLGGTIILIVIACYSILQLLISILNAIPPINTNYDINLSLISHLSFIVLIAVLALPNFFFYQKQNIKST